MKRIKKFIEEAHVVLSEINHPILGINSFYFIKIAGKDMEMLWELRMNLESYFWERCCLMHPVFFRNNAWIAQMLLIFETQMILLHPWVHRTNVKFFRILVHVWMNHFFMKLLNLLTFRFFKFIYELWGIKFVASTVFIFRLYRWSLW